MMQHIQIEQVLRETVQTPYRDLVTRSTGRAVRTSIQLAILAEGAGLAMLDFSDVGLVDFSCADEIVAKLLLDPPQNTYLVLEGLTEDHLEAIQHVLEHHAIAALVHDRASGRSHPVGRVGADLRTAFSHLQALGASTAAVVATDLGWSPTHAADVLDALARLRLVRNTDGCYAVPLET